VFPVGKLLGLFWEIQTWLGTEKEIWEIKKRNELVVRQQNSRGCRLTQSLEEFVWKVSTLPTETLGKVETIE